MVPNPFAASCMQRFMYFSSIFTFAKIALLETNEEVEIRRILPGDNDEIAPLIRGVLEEHEVPREGTAFADVSLIDMWLAYNRPRAIYFVMREYDKIIGGAGIAQLDNYRGNVCELQKMYFAPQARGRGLGKLLLKKCLKAAIAYRYESCYLETMPYMEAAQKLYLQFGFGYINSPLGDTGHHACTVRMLKSLK